MTEPAAENRSYVKPMRFAYADPPYLGQALRWYGDQPTYGGEVDHGELIGRLCAEYDGWALSSSAAALRDLLPQCPAGVRVAIWHRTHGEPPGNRGRWWWCWEPVIVHGGRWKYGDGPTVRDVRSGYMHNGQARAHDLPGQKPPEFCRWVLDLLGYVDGDELDDLFPGTGIMGRVLDQGRLPL
jgi:hypothetical protein